MSNLAKDATLHHCGSHSVAPSSRTGEGISNEEVFFYINAVWRGQPVVVTMRADRYAALYHDENSLGGSCDKLTPWRVYSSEARYGSMDERGEAVTGTARAALSKLCEPLVVEWLKSDEYTASYQRAVARMIMRHFDDQYFGLKYISEALDKFDTVLPVEIKQAIAKARSAYSLYAQAKEQAFETINGE